MSGEPEKPSAWARAVSRSNLRVEWAQKLCRGPSQRRRRLGRWLADLLHRPPDEEALLELFAWLLLVLLLAVTVRHV